MMYWAKAAIMTAFILAIFAPSVAAEGWALVTKNNTFDQRGERYGDANYTSLSLFTTDKTKPEIRFSCSTARGLKTTILFQPEAQGILDGGRKIKFRTKKPIVNIEGRKPVRHAWTYFKSIRTMQTRRGETARMLYNAAVKGQSFEVKEPAHDRISVVFPPINDAFRKFARDCYITNGGKKSN